MMLGPTQYVLIILSILIVLWLIRWIVELRFHFQFSRVGFFSITGIRYYQDSKLGKNGQKVSFAIGKIKARLKHPSYSASTAWVTIHVSDIDFNVPSLQALRSSQRKTIQRPNFTLNRCLSAVGNQLGQISRVYPTSAVKHILKFISALPAQLVMAGLANYVDVQVNRLRISMDGVGVLSVEHLSLSSTLFTALSRTPYTASSGARPETGPRFKPAELGMENNHHARLRQRHSLKRAEHLFKEKFLEITVQIGHIGFHPIGNPAEIFSLPMGSKLAIACHLSAGCVTLKEVEANMHVGAIHVKLDRLANFATTLQSPRELRAESAPKPKPKHASNGSNSSRLTGLFRNITLSISDTALTSETAHGLYTSIRLHALTLSASTPTSASPNGVVEMITVQSGIDLITWSIFNNKPDLATECFEPIRIPKTRISAAYTTGAMQHDNAKSGRAHLMEAVDPQNTIPQPLSDYKGIANSASSANLDILLQEPKITVDTDKIRLLTGFMTPDGTKAAALSTPKLDSLAENNTRSKKKQLDGFPQMLVSIRFRRPLVDFCNSSINRTGHGHGVISCEEIKFEATGEYTPIMDKTMAAAAAATSIASPPPSPTLEEPTSVRRRRVASKAWDKIKLFAKSRQGSKDSRHDSSETLVAIQWAYKLRFKAALDEWTLRSGRSITAAAKETPLLVVEHGEISFQTKMSAWLSEDTAAASTVFWDWEKQSSSNSNRIDFSLRAPVFHLGRTKDEALHFWFHKVAPSFKKTDAREQPPPTRRAKPLKMDAVRHLKVTAEVTRFAIVVSSIDEGLRGNREVPVQYTDNAPEKDIQSEVTVAFGMVTIDFTGADLSRPNRSSMTADDYTESPSRSKVGAVHASLKNFTIKNRFHATGGKDDDLLVWCSRITTGADIVAHEEESMSISPAIVVKKIGCQYSIETHYILLLAAYNILQLKRKLGAHIVEKSPVVKRKPSKLALEKIQFQINRTDIAVALSKDTHIYVRMDMLRTEFDNMDGWEPSLKIRNLTVFGEAPNHPSKWDQLIELDNVEFQRLRKIDTVRGGMKQKYYMDMSKILLRIPYQFVMADIVDNAVNFMKSLKAMHGRLSGSKPFTYLGPTPTPGPKVLPKIRLKCNAFRFQLDDDPFETDLRLIWRTGLKEQQKRLRLEDAFAIKAQTVMQTPGENTSRRGFDNEQARSHFLDTINSAKMRKSNSSSPRDKEESADARIKDAYAGLQEMLSKDWIKSIREARHKEISEHRIAQFSDYRGAFSGSQQEEMYDSQQDDDSDGTTAELFRIETLPIPPHPPLCDFTIMQMTLDAGLPTFPVEDTRVFVHENGKGIPIDTPFSTLIPFHLDWRAGETWVQVRDYPLPMLLVPPPTSCPLDDDHTEQSWFLSGDYVFADGLGDYDATRRITIPIIKDTYSIDITRTSTPAKFYSIVNIDVHTLNMTSISWSVPYQPAVQEISRAFDSFTRPPVDPSPKVGFWDKIRLIIHTKAKISFVGGGDLSFLMKGTRDPYDTSERGYGLAKVWSNNVVLLLGYDNPDNEVLQIISQDYAFGVPDLRYGGYTATYILPGISKALDNHSSDGKDIPCAPKRTRTLTSLLDASRSDPRFVKVALKLSDGIQMGIGFHLERMCGPGCEKCKEKSSVSANLQYDQSRCRHLTFLPHYEVNYKTPQVVNAMPDHGEHYDAYEGFRSDFIHMSISIIKLSSEKAEKCDIATANMNSMHLSPGFIDHFVTWFRLFGGAVSYPLRSGSLYPRADPRPTKKFGKHMSSMKYKVMLHPLVIGYFYKDEYSSDNDRHIEETGDSVGLKGVVAGFNVDIHQQRVVIDVTDHKLDQKRLKANWPVHEAEIHLSSIDLRAVLASFSGTMPSSLSSDSAAQTVGAPSIVVGSSGDSTDDSSVVDPDLMDGLDRNENEENEPSDWVDPDDYVELERTTPIHPPSVRVLPFVYSPLIYFLKQPSRADREKYRYLRETHNCIMGTAGDTRSVQMGFLKRRSQDIDVQIRKHQARLHVVESKLSATDNKKFLEESHAIVEKTEILFEKRNQIQRYLKDLEKQHMPDVDNAAYSSSTVFGKDSLAEWEELMGYFKQRCIVHNPQIIWNNAVRNIIYHFLDLQAHRRALSYYGSMRAVKFLRDLTEATHKQRRRNKKDTVVVDDSDEGWDSQMTQDLLEKLLAEKDTKLVAINETEDPEEAGRGVDNDMPSGAKANVNDPVWQKNSIPEGYEMKSSYLVDLLHPQVSLQSDKYPDSLVLMSNERMQVKAFSIIDVHHPDAEMDLVKQRTIVSIENSQFYVAKKERFDSVDLLLDNHYGAEQSDRWLAWIPPEMLINYVKGTDQFQRIGHRLAASMQYDKYNQLRFKTHPTSFEQSHPFEDPSDSVHLNFPVLDLVVNSAQYNAMYEVITDLLLYKEPAKKERLDRLREIMMAVDRNSLHEVTERIASLQDRVRNLVSNYNQYRTQLHHHHLDLKAAENMRPMRQQIREYQEELYLDMEAIKLTQQSNQRKDYHEPKTNLKFVFSAEKIIWRMMIDQDTPLCEWQLTNTMYVLINREDRSSSNTVEIEVLHVKNTSPNPVFTDVIGPYYANASRAPDFSRHKMLRGYLANLPPVGGIPVIQHLEINLFPLRLQMTYEFGKALASFLFPTERRNHKTTATAEKVPVTAASASESVTEGSSFHSSASMTDIRNLGDNETESLTPSGLAEAGGSNSSANTELLSNPSSRKGLKPSSKKKRGKKDAVDDLSVMKKRASSNCAFLLVKIPGTRHCLSYRGPKEKNIEDLRDFTFHQPNLEYNNETWSWFELISCIKKDFMRAALLTNSGALIKEKLMIRRHHPKNERDRLLESNISTQSTFSAIHDDMLGDALGDTEHELSESSHDELEDRELEQDAASLHSLSLFEGGIGGEPDMSGAVPHGGGASGSHGSGARRFLHWPLKSRKRQVSDPYQEDAAQRPNKNDKRHSIDSLEMHPQLETSTALYEELTRKGRMLLGKKYNGPIYAFSAGSLGNNSDRPIKGRRQVMTTDGEGLNL
ncbi:golgi-body localization protein domain-containing protein [Dichotomocladium elegans]|nr:golgi-body localization protein domain-containing protein [Dichotomocladium elegans]